MKKIITNDFANNPSLNLNFIFFIAYPLGSNVPDLAHCFFYLFF